MCKALCWVQSFDKVEICVLMEVMIWKEDEMSTQKTL